MNNELLSEQYLDTGIFPEDIVFDDTLQVLEYIFSNGSSTFFKSAKYFPKEVAEAISALYGFVRVADDYVDEGEYSLDQRRKRLLAIKDLFYNVLNEGFEPASKVGRFIVVPFAQLVKDHNIGLGYIEAFFESMMMDLNAKSYNIFQDTIDYIYGSAEVIGLMIAQILNLKGEAFEYAASLGVAFQLINFIRDLAEDYKRGRTYFPLEDLVKCNLKNLSIEETKANPEGFAMFMKIQIDRYREEQAKAVNGFKYLDKTLRIAIKTAFDMYNLTADVIEKDPAIIYERKVKPSKTRIKLAGLKNTIKILLTEG